MSDLPIPPGLAEFLRSDLKIQIVGLVGSGGMSFVFRGLQHGVEGFEKAVAVKVHKGPGRWRTAHRDRVGDEARLVACLRHPNIVQALRLESWESHLIAVFEIVEGPTLAELIDRSRVTGVPIPFSVVVAVLHQVCTGLDWAHRAVDETGTSLRIVHRDVAPANILLDPAGLAKLADFGIAKSTLSDRAWIEERSDRVSGTLGYLSPEQIRGLPTDARSDVFSTGAVLFEAITGRCPFRGSTLHELRHSILHEPVPSVASDRAGVSVRDGGGHGGCALGPVPLCHGRAAQRVHRGLSRGARRSVRPRRPDGRGSNAEAPATDDSMCQMRHRATRIPCIEAHDVEGPHDELAPTR